MTARGDRIDVAFGFFAIPLLIRRPPDFGLPAIPTGKGPINVELGQRTVGIDVFQLVLLGGNSARVDRVAARQAVAQRGRRRADLLPWDFYPYPFCGTSATSLRFAECCDYPGYDSGR